MRVDWNTGGWSGRDPEPFQSLQDHLGRSFRAALAVGVLDAEQEFAAVVAGEQIIEQRGAGAADMQQPGRAGSEAGSNRHACDLARAFIGCRGCGVNLLCMQQRVVRWLDAWQAAERGRLVLWLPVFMGTGVLAISRCAPNRRCSWAWWLLFPPLLPAVCLHDCLCCEQWQWQLRPWQSALPRHNSPPCVHLRSRRCPDPATVLTGKVRSVELLPEGRRIALEARVSMTESRCKRWLRVRLRKGD